MATEKMFCPGCGREMNHHAMKIDYSAEPVDPVFGGVLEEAHTCPGCGKVELRRAAAKPLGT